VPRRSPPRSKAAARRSSCPIAGALDLVGDKWTLVVVRDLLLLGKHQYGELAASPEGIPSNVLAERLDRLIGAGLVAKARYSDRPPRYRYTLTEKGAQLAPVLGALADWGERHLPGTRRPAALRRAR
jgi:DNA-binding HxlR family transcriptional regulator